MADPRVLILRAPGTNCDEETAYAFEIAGAKAQRIHVNQLIANPTIARSFQILCIPGGFSYGDDIAAGRILASQLKRHLRDTIDWFRSEDRLVLGICNGFQVLMRMGLLNDATDSSVKPPAPTSTLTWNDHGQFEDRWVHLRVDQTPCVFLRNIDRMYLPIAHAEGKFVTDTAASLQAMASEGRLALRYAAEDDGQNLQGSADGKAVDTVLPFPANPNGSQANVAGVCDASGRLFGLMPHPERHIDPTHHPTWTRREHQPEFGDGYAIFKNAVDYFRE